MEKDKILNIPSLSMFNNNWDLLLKFMDNEGNPPFHFDGDLNLAFTIIETLGSLFSVEGKLLLYNNKNITTLGKLEHVGGLLDLSNSNIESLGNLKSVGMGLGLINTPNLKMTKEDILKHIKVGGNIIGKLPYKL